MMKQEEIIIAAQKMDAIPFRKGNYWTRLGTY